MFHGSIVDSLGSVAETGRDSEHLLACPLFIGFLLILRELLKNLNLRGLDLLETVFNE